MAEAAPKPRALVGYKVFATLDLTAPGAGGFLSLAPPSGFVDAASGPHFFKVRCLFCGDETEKDVAVFALAPAAQACTDRFPLRLLAKRCHPTCPDPAHLVRKCSNRDCLKLESVEVYEVAGSLKAGLTHFLTVKALGCQIIDYCAGQKWEAVSPAGEAVPVMYTTYAFKGLDATGANISIPAAFDIVQVEDEDVA